MDRVKELRCGSGGGEAGGSGSRDSTLDTTSPPSEAYISANDSSSKYFSLSDSTFDINPIKDVSLASTTVEPDRAITDPDITDPDGLISNLSPIGKKDIMDSYKIGKQIEAANILSGGVDIFDDNENSFDGDELVIDDNIEIDDKCNEKGEEQSMVDAEVGMASKDTEVVLQIDGNNVNAIDIGNGLYLYRKHGQEELAAVQIIDDGQQQPTFKFLKVRENSEGNLEVYEEIEIEIPKEVPTKEESESLENSTSHVPVKDLNKVSTDMSNTKVTELNKSPQKPPIASTSDGESELKETLDTKSELNLNRKMMKFSESRKSPVVGSFTPMTYHSTPNKEGKPLTKTMVDLQLNPSRHSDNIKKTIEVHTDSNKQRPVESQTKKTVLDSTKVEDSSDITETTEIANNTIDVTNKEVKIVEKIEVSEQTEPNNKTKSKELADNNMEISENTEIKQDGIVEKLVVDEDLESNEIGKLVIDEKLEELIKSTESDKVVEKESYNVLNENANKNAESITEAKEHNTEENTKLDVKILKEDNTSDAKDSQLNIEKPDIIILSQKNLNIKKNEKPENTERVQQLIPIIDKKEGVPNKDKEVGSAQMAESERECKVAKPQQLPQQSVTNVSLIDENKKLIVEDAKALTAKKEIEVISLPTSAPSIKTSDDNMEQGMLNVAKTMTNIPLIINEQLNKKEEITPPQSSTVAKPHKPDEKLVPKIETIPTNKQVITVKETADDNKPSYLELSKAIEPKTQSQVTIDKFSSEVKPAHNNHNAVPFGKWTEVNRQEFLNKFKEHKVPVNTNSKQIKNSNDLNRRDVLKKIDSQRQSNIASFKDKTNVKNETIFSNKLPPPKIDSVVPVKKDGIEVKPKLTEPVQGVSKPEIPPKSVVPSAVSSSTVNTKLTKKEPTQQKESSAPDTSVAKTEPTPRREVNVNDLINKTIEDMLNKVVPMRALSDDTKQLDKKDQVTTYEESSVKDSTIINKNEAVIEQNNILDDIEIKMNELHGIPFVERPPHELPKVQQTEVKLTNKIDVEKSPTKIVQKHDVDVTIVIPDNAIDVDSEEEVIEHEPITGDIEPILPPQEVILNTDQTKSPVRNEATKKETVITEKDFDKFARRNSITYDNCKTVSIETKETYNVVQNFKNRDVTLPKDPNKEHFPFEVISKLPLKQPLRLNTYSRKPNTLMDDPNSKNYQSKIHIAYHSALTAKMDRRAVDRPITIIEDKPVKVVFMENTAEFVPGQLNVQGQELSPNKKVHIEPSKIAASDSSSNLLEQTEDKKQIDDHKSKTKHQRKQVLTPVETPELELIQPSDIGIDVSPKKKRKVEDNKNDKHYKNLVHKKSYLLGRSTASEDKNYTDVPKTSPKENKLEEITVNINATSALDNLVKAAELIENQSEKMSANVTPTSDNPQSTPVKRGRGRPRKTPIPENDDTKLLTPQKKPRLIDAKPVKDDSATDEDSSDGEMVKENWTMGKINENIVCPICSKLFRSENVVFKHVKHCTGVSPNRSDSDKRSPRRDRRSQESDLKSLDSRSDMEIDNEEKTTEIKKNTPKRIKSKEISSNSDDDKTEVIVIEDTPVKKKSESNYDQRKEKKMTKTKIPPKSNNLVCEFCGKTFRQLSYLVNHKLQHKKDEMIKKNGKDNAVDASKKAQVFSCEVCKKEFRKLHHLVQHRIIHNTNAEPSRNLRKASSEQIENKSKDETISKQNDDPSAAFRCEPCDKSFRKLHHLVEHRETHDGINRQKVSPSTTSGLEQAPAPPQCDVCKKTFRKLYHLVEHKEQHLETSSEKSDDKSVKSGLSTKDIIHECSLCYMVFPNEQSLNKHSGNCQRKKRQSKSAKNEMSDENAIKSDENLDKEDKGTDNNVPKIIAEEIIDDDDDVSIKSAVNKDETITLTSTKTSDKINTSKNNENSEFNIKEKSPPSENTKTAEQDQTIISTIEKPEAPKENVPVLKENITISDNIKKVEDKDVKTQTHKKRTSIKVVPTVTKRRRTVETTVVTANEVKPVVESSDDDEIRYMFNPNYKVDETKEGKVFMKVRANKRNSLQIERPNSKDLVKRRTSLQHPPKIPRLKTKPVEPKIVSPSHTILKTVPKIPKIKVATSTDSDDSDVKYSFPKNIPEKTVKSLNEPAKKPGRKSIDKRKSLTGVAKRKSLGQSVVAAKNKNKTTPVKTVKKRTVCVEHRCDCGQLFSSAALLSRHTSLAHTPPRIRRRRSPPPDPHSSANKPTAPPAARKSIRHDIAAAPTEARKSVKPDKTDTKSATPKSVTRRSTTAHRGVPVPDKMRKLIQKNKK